MFYCDFTLIFGKAKKHLAKENLEHTARSLLTANLEEPVSMKIGVSLLKRLPRARPAVFRPEALLHSKVSLAFR